MDKKRLLGNGMLFLAAFIWGTSFVFQRVGMQRIEPLTFGSARMILAAIFLFILVRISDSLQRRKGPLGEEEREAKQALIRRTMKGGLVCGLFLTLGTSFQQMGIVSTTAGKTGFITALYMVFVPVLGWLLFRRQVTWLVGLSVLLATAGMYLLSIKEDFTLTRGDALVFVCAIFFALHILSCDHYVKAADPLRLSMYQFMVCALLAGLAALLFETPTLTKLQDAAVPILFTGILSGGVGYTLQLLAQKFTDPTVASLILSLEAVFGALGGWLILNEVMTPREVLGCLVVFTAIILVQIPLPRQEERTSS